MNTAPLVISGLGELTPEEQARAATANDSFQRACEDCGIKVSSWMDFQAWKNYVQGNMEEPELVSRAQEEIADLAKTFGKYMVIKEEEPVSMAKHPEQRERARVANRIYKRVCEEKGLTLCFFSSFSIWSDFVKGRTDEAEFYALAKNEAEKMSGQSKVA